MRILVINHQLPQSDRNAGDRRLYELLKLLVAKHEVDYWSLTRDCPEEYEQALEKIGVRVLPHWHGNLTRALLGKAYEATIIEFWHCAEIALKSIRQIQPWAHVIVDSVDVHFSREEAGLRLGFGTPATVARCKARELAMYREADAVIVVTEEDHRILENAGGIRRLVGIPIIHPVRPRQALDRKPEMLFVGGFNHLPNVDGITWFANEVFPLIQVKLPAAQLTVVGGKAPAEVAALGTLPGINVAGHVPEIGPYLDRAAVSVAPLRYGGGMKGKVAEALAAGMPVVTTTFGAQGYSPGANPGLLVADSAQGFAEHVIRLLGNQAAAEEAGRRGQQFISGLCGPAAVRSRVDELLSVVKPAPLWAGPNLALRRWGREFWNAFKGMLRRTGIRWIYRKIRPAA